MTIGVALIPTLLAPALHRERVTALTSAPTVHPVADADGAWPAATFNRYLSRLMKVNRIPDMAELSRLSGVNQTNLSNYKRGLAQPSIEVLNKLAPVLDVAPVHLWIQAGRVSPSDLDLSREPNFDTVPREVRELAELAESLPDSDRRGLLDAVAMLIDGYRQRLKASKSPR